MTDKSAESRVSICVTKLVGQAFGLALLSLAFLGPGDAAEYPSAANFDRMLSLCAAGSGLELDADLRGSIVSIYERDRTEGTMTLRHTADFLASIPAADRLKAYEIYLRCITDIVTTFSGPAGSGPAADPLEIGPTRTTWSAQFARWPTGSNAQGSYSPTSDNAGASLSLRPNSNTWLGPGPVTIKPVDGDFQADIAFHIPSDGDMGLQSSLGQTGTGHRTSLEFFVSRWRAGQPTYSVYVYTVQGMHVTSNRRIAEREPLPIQVDWTGSNILSIRRVGATIGYYFNDTLLTSFDAPVFRVAQLSISAAFPGEIQFNSISVHEPEPR